MLSLTAPRSVLRLLGVALVPLAVAACGDPERPPPAQSNEDIDLADLVRYDASSADLRDIFASGSCEDGAVQECRIYLPSHNGVQPCFVGQQVCGGAQWGECGSGTLVDANANDAELDPDDLPPP
jgi:hypothetical protein